MVLFSQFSFLVKRKHWVFNLFTNKIYKMKEIVKFILIVFSLIMLMYISMKSKPYERYSNYEYVEFKKDTTTYLEIRYIYNNGRGGIPMSTIIKKY